MRRIILYYVTYQHVLREDKTIHDFQGWLKRVWPMQKRWGAQFVKCWVGSQDNHLLNCRYAVNNLKEWNQHNATQSAGFYTQKLSEIVELNRLSVTITPYSEHAATEFNAP